MAIRAEHRALDLVGAGTGIVPKARLQVPGWIWTLGLAGVLTVGMGSALDPASAQDAVDSPTPGGISEPEPEPRSVFSPLVPLPPAAAAAVLAHMDWPDDPQALDQAIAYSLAYLATTAATHDYAERPADAHTPERVRASLVRLRELIHHSPDTATLRQALQTEFAVYAARGHDGQGTVHFTGYFEPVFTASRTPSPAYPYPLYRRPSDLEQWPLPHPTRADLEGMDGRQGHRGPLAGLELVWLQDRLEAFLVQVQGSATLELADGGTLGVGYAGRTDYPYTSIGRAVVADGHLTADQLSLPNLVAFFQAQPAALNTYLPQNQRFIFFRETEPGRPTGSLSVPVTAGLSIATDKALMPPGAPALIALDLPQQDPQGQWQSHPIHRLVLDQDTGGAIIGPGRVDLFTGTGTAAGELAGRINTNGGLYYLLLADPTP